MNKFKSGDPVWVRVTFGCEVQELSGITPGEYPGIVRWPPDFTGYYGVETPTIPNLKLGGFVNFVQEPYMRPRRDDYQQHEPLGRRQDLDKPISTPMPTKELEFLEAVHKHYGVKS